MNPDRYKASDVPQSFVPVDDSSILKNINSPENCRDLVNPNC